MTDWNNPSTSQTHSNELAATKGRDESVAVMDFSSDSNIPDDTIRWNATAQRFEIWDATGASWSELVSKYLINVDQLDGRDAGNANGDVPINNGTLNTDLNADQLDGEHGAFYRDAGNLNAGLIPDARVPESAVTQHQAAVLNASGLTAVLDRVNFDDNESSDLSSDGDLVWDLSDGLYNQRSGVGYLVWDQGNDGSGSGLNADLLDGQHASAFATVPVTADEIDAGAVGASEIADGAVGQSEVAASAIGQGELKTATWSESVLGGGTTRKATGAGQYGFGNQSKFAFESDGVSDNAGTFIGRADGTGDSWIPQEVAAGTDTSQLHVVTLYAASSTGDVYARGRYIQASPPYDMGDGECGLFVMLDVLASGKVVGASISPDPVWANNGPTNIRPDYIDKATGRAYKRIRRPGVTREDVLAGRADMDDRVAALKEAPVEDVEITMAYKNADMDLFPHSWLTPPQGTIVMLDPVNTHDLLMLHDEGEDVAELMHKGYVQIGDEVKRKGPPGVVPVTFGWRKTR